MVKNSVIKYLHEFVNRTENIESLLRLFITTSESRYGAMFVQEGVSSLHKCIEYLHLDIDEVNEPMFEPIAPILNVIFSPENTEEIGLKSFCELNNILIVPISVHEDRIGVLVLANRESEYTEELIEIISPYISLTQLILNKQKLIRDFKKIYSDSSYFSKDLFLANMSHEIRTPLNGVIGYNQLLMQTSLTTTQKGYLVSMNQCSIQLMQIINDVLDFSKLASGQMLVSDDCFTIQDIIESVNNALHNRIIEKKQDLSFNIDSEVPHYLVTDKQKLIQIIINLISNANKFTDVCGIINVNFKLSQTDILEVKIEDNGIGISEQDQCKLFNTFMQIENSLCKTGSGLGLTICKKLIELLEGEINIKSILGVGSVFEFNIKIKQYEEFEKLIERDVKDLKDKIILVVDDNEDNRILLSEMLFGWDMRPIICASANEALRMIVGNRYNFSMGLIDICMPDISGTSLAKQIKTEQPRFPLIALSSIDSFINSSDFEYKLDKPINKVQLFDAIHKIIIKNQTPSAYIGEDIIQSPASRHSVKDIKILIAEDISYNRNILVNFLETLGYTNIETSVNGQDAFEKMQLAHNQEDPYKILLLDIRMPVMDGYDVIQAIYNSNIYRPQIIVITASVLDSDRNKCKESGIKYFITKPIDLSQLNEVMNFISDLSYDTTC